MYNVLKEGACENMARSYKKEAEWARKVYKQFFFKCRTDNGELERLQAVLDGRPFADWVREKLIEDEERLKADTGCPGE